MKKIIIAITLSIFLFVGCAEQTAVKEDDGLYRDYGEYESAYFYVVNKSTGKFHYDDCSSAEQIIEKNRAISNLSREELIERGYSPCGRCKP